MWNQAAVYRRRRRTFAATVVLVVVLIIIVSSTSGGRVGPPTTPRTGTTASTSTLPQSPAPLTYATVASLREPVRASMAAAVPGHTEFSMMGGLDASGNATGGVAAITSKSTTPVGSLPASLFAGAAVTIGNDEYLFGGAEGTFDNPKPEFGILRYSVLGSGEVVEIATLPTVNYGCSAAVIGSTAYVVGGDDGTTTLNTIVAYRPGGHATIAGRLPVPLRYTAVAAVDGKLVIAGGLLANNKASKLIYVFDPTTLKTRPLHAQLPIGIYAAASVALGKLVYVIGGAYPSGPASAPTLTTVATIYSIDPVSGRLASAGTLTAGARAEAAAVKVGDTVYLAGGLTGSATSAAVGTLTPTATKAK